MGEKYPWGLGTGGVVVLHEKYNYQMVKFFRLLEYLSYPIIGMCLLFLPPTPLGGVSRIFLSFLIGGIYLLILRKIQIKLGLLGKN